MTELKMEKVKYKVPLDYTYFHIESNAQEDVFRIKGVKNAAEADEWVRKVSRENKIIWRTGKTYPKAGRKVVYRKDYRCQHLTDKRSKGTRVSKNTDCPAKLHIAIQRYREKSQAEFNPPFLKEFPAEVVFKGEHNHSLNFPGPLRSCDMSDETKAKLTKLFLEGHLPSSAVNSLKLDLMSQNPDNYSKIIADGRYLPSLSLVHSLYHNTYAVIGESFKGGVIDSDLKQIAQTFRRNSEGITRYCEMEDGLESFIVVLTKLMMRCHREAKQSCDTVLLDSSVVINKNRARAHIFTTDGLPLGIIITSSSKEKVFADALSCYKQLLGDIGFYSVGHPKFFLTYNYKIDRKSLKSVFPMTSVFLCQFHVLKSMWSWLCHKTHAIDVDHRQSFYFLFKRVVYSCMESEAEENATDFLDEASSLGHPNLVAHFSSLWEVKTDWVSYYRKNLLTQYREQECSHNTKPFEMLQSRGNSEITAEEQLAFECLIGRIRDFVSTNPNVFVPALKQMLENAKKYAESESGLLSAMKSFAIPPVSTSSQDAEQVECSPSQGVAIRTPPNSKRLMHIRKKLIERRRKSFIRQRTLRSRRPQDSTVCPQLQQEIVCPQLQQEQVCPQLQQEPVCSQLQQELVCHQLLQEPVCPQLQQEPMCPQQNDIRIYEHDYTNFGALSSKNENPQSDQEHSDKDDEPFSELESEVTTLPADVQSKLLNLNSSNKIGVLLNMED